MLHIKWLQGAWLLRRGAALSGNAGYRLFAARSYAPLGGCAGLQAAAHRRCAGRSGGRGDASAGPVREAQAERADERHGQAQREFGRGTIIIAALWPRWLPKSPSSACPK